MDLETIIATLRAVLVELEGKLPAGDIENASGLIDAGEPGVALENLCTQLHEYDVRVPRFVVAQIAAAGGAMQLEPDLWTDLIVES
jgi:hypothetical protein